MAQHKSHRKTFKRKVVDFLYEHPIQREILRDSWCFLMMAISAFIFALGFKCFIAPNYLMTNSTFNGDKIDPVLKLVSGGVSGVSQTIIEFIDVTTGHSISANNVYSLVYSILYFGLNIPVFLIAFFGIGKRFAIMTAINVALVSVFSNVLTLADGENGFITQISYWANENGGMLSRTIFGGVLTGLSSALAYRMDASAGGIDVVAYYVALKKSTLVGKYSLYINAITLVTFTILSAVDHGIGTSETAHVLVASLFSIIYLLVVAAVIDMINLRNKKVKLTVVSSMQDLGRIIIANIPHGATMVKGSGVFSQQDKYIIEIAISSYEVKKAIQVVREADPSAFIEVMELRQVFGRFHQKPIK